MPLLCYNLLNTLHILGNRASNILIDTGNVDHTSLVVFHLDKQSVEMPDYGSVSHAHEDHAEGLANVLAAYESGTVFSLVTD